MLRSLLLASSAMAAIVGIMLTSQPVEAGSCKVIVAEGRGSDKDRAAARAEKHLTFKVNRWASKNGYSAVSGGKTSGTCSYKGVIYHCVVSRQVCG